MTSDRVLPLQTTVASEVPAIHFAKAVVTAFNGLERLSAEVNDDAVLISAVWEPDFELAANLIQVSFPGEVRWGEPKVLYRIEPKILEPILHVEVRTPPDYVGNVIGDLMSRRGLMLGQDDSHEYLVIAADVPLAQLFGYRKVLNLITAGKGEATAVFARYSPAPPGFDPNEPAAMALRAS
jgi:translation elongation factor EF-G